MDPAEVFLAILVLQTQQLKPNTPTGGLSRGDLAILVLQTQQLKPPGGRSREPLLALAILVLQTQQLKPYMPFGDDDDGYSCNLSSSNPATETFLAGATLAGFALAILVLQTQQLKL